MVRAGEEAQGSGFASQRWTKDSDGWAQSSGLVIFYSFLLCALRSALCAFKFSFLPFSIKVVIFFFTNFGNHFDIAAIKDRAKSAKIGQNWTESDMRFVFE